VVEQGSEAGVGLYATNGTINNRINNAVIFAAIRKTFELQDINNNMTLTATLLTEGDGI
jgi:hypothetical protein